MLGTSCHHAQRWHVTEMVLYLVVCVARSAWGTTDKRASSGCLPRAVTMGVASGLRLEELWAVSASILARPVHPVIPNRRERAQVAMRQVLSSAFASWTRAWVLISVLGSWCPLQGAYALKKLGRF